MKPDRSGETVGSYRLVAHLGAAATCDLYLAERSDGLYERRVVMRLLAAAGDREAFGREREALAALDHPNLVRFLDAGEARPGEPFVVVEQVEGMAVDRYCDARRLSIEERLTLFLGVAAGVHSAHQRFVVHGDLRAANVLVTPEGVPKVSLFSTRRAAGEGGDEASANGAETAGTTTASDLQALGSLLWTLLVGRPPDREGGGSAARAAGRVSRSVAARRGLSPRGLRRRIAGDLDAILRVVLGDATGTAYLSAWALARDVERHLAGEAVTARGRGAAYRVSRWLSRRRGLATAVALSLAAVSALVAEGISDRREARERVRLAQHFGQRGEEMAELVRLAELLPRHPTAYVRDEVKRRMAQIESEASRSEGMGDGPAAYALGRGYLALGDPAQARLHLERAWSRGFDGPDTALALGTALGALYRRALEESDRVDELAERSAARREASTAFRDPALAYLRASREAENSSSTYVEGLIAFYDGRLDEALSLARRALTEAPWILPARELEAAVLVEQASSEQRRGRYEEARRLYDLAGEASAQVLEVARSDAHAHARECARTARLVRLEHERGTLDGDTVAAALEPCQAAVEIDPQLVDGYAYAARIRARWADRLLRRGEDPGPVLAALDGSVAAVLAREPTSAVALRLRGDAQLTRARWRFEHGEGPWEALDQAVAAYGAAAQARPSDAELHNACGSAHLVRARFRLARGHREASGFEAAASAYRQAGELDPDYAAAHSNLGAALLERARAAMAEGEPAETSIRAAIPALERALELSSGPAGAHQNLGAAYLALGLDRLHRELDPLPALAVADRHFDRALELDPAYFPARHNAGVTAQLRGAHALRAGLDPRPTLARSLALFEEARRARPAAAAISEAAQGLSHLLSARAALAREEDPRRAFAAAEEALERALEVDPALIDALATRAELQWHRARVAEGEARDRRVRLGLAATERCLAVNPAERRTQTVEGALLVLAARTATPAVRQELVARALPLLETGLGGTALWDPETFRPVLAEARALMTDAAGRE